MTTDDQVAEVAKCYRSAAYFIDTYCWIYDAPAAGWVRFRLWPFQQDVIGDLWAHRLNVILKARQLGLTWLVLCFALWLMLFRPAVTVLVFSRRDPEAVYLLGEERLRGVWEKLPEWLVHGVVVTTDNDHEWSLSNGSVARAFPTSAGDSYTASLAIVDEADLVPDLNRLMRSVKPTIDAGGRMVLLSRSDKTKPLSEFKQMYRAAKAGASPWHAIFLPWSARPDRTPAWYAEQKADIEGRTGSDDDLLEQYPATDLEALAPRTLDKRLPPKWMERAYQELAPLLAPSLVGAPALTGLVVYKPPEPGKTYVIGVDTAEGNPGSDPTALTVLEEDTGEEVATISARLEPAVTGAAAARLAEWYNDAGVLVERNNHGHAVLLWLRDNSRRTDVIRGLDGRPGWLSNSRGKTMLYDRTAEALRDETPAIHTWETAVQLMSIEGSTLLAPTGQHDDRADSYALAIVARGRRRPRPKAESFQG